LIFILSHDFWNKRTAETMKITQMRSLNPFKNEWIKTAQESTKSLMKWFTKKCWHMKRQPLENSWALG